MRRDASIVCVCVCVCVCVRVCVCVMCIGTNAIDHAQVRSKKLFGTQHLEHKLVPPRMETDSRSCVSCELNAPKRCEADRQLFLLAFC